jgi:hypothetical protein
VIHVVLAPTADRGDAANYKLSITKKTNPKNKRKEK